MKWNIKTWIVSLPFYWCVAILWQTLHCVWYNFIVLVTTNSFAFGDVIPKLLSHRIFIWYYKCSLLNMDKIGNIINNILAFAIVPVGYNQILYIKSGPLLLKEFIPSLRSWLWHHRLPNVTTTEAQSMLWWHLGVCGVTAMTGNEVSMYIFPNSVTFTH